MMLKRGEGKDGFAGRECDSWWADSRRVEGQTATKGMGYNETRNHVTAVMVETDESIDLFMLL